MTQIWQRFKEKPIKNSILLFLALAVVALAVPVIKRKLTITDPNNPRFDITKFDFDNYRGNEEIAPVLQKLIPIGTSRPEVERILVDIGHAHCREISKKELNLPKGGPSYNSETDKRIDDEGARASKIILCQKRGRSPIFVGWWVTVFYDSNDRVQQIASLNKLIF